MDLQPRKTRLKFPATVLIMEAFHRKHAKIVADRGEIIDQNFLRRVRDRQLPVTSTYNIEESGLTASRLTEMFESQLLSRHLDLHSRRLRSRGESFYTIGSSGHEGNAAIAAAFRPTDMAFLHYRDAAFLIQRSKALPGQTPLMDMLLSFAASKDDPISGGRHKVLGSKSLFIPPQTSTIASHLPKAVGAAISIGLNKRRKADGALPSDSIILCSFGDASLNHSSAQGAINTASWTAYRKIHLPLVFICEDNGIGISTPTPAGWIYESMRHRPGIQYFHCNGLDLIDTYIAAQNTECYVRAHRMPAFLCMRCVRLMGHAGADAETVYLSDAEIENNESHDPLLYSASLLIGHGIVTADEIINLYSTTARNVEEVAEEAIRRPKLASAEEIMSMIIPPKRALPSKPLSIQRDELLKDELASFSKPYNMARLINWALADLMLEHDNIILAGEDIGRKGGVYAVTSKLQSLFGAHRVVDTLLDEQSILGLAIGMAHNNLLPIPEIQFLAYLHNAEDQLRGEAATLSFFSQGQYTNPMVIRIAGLPYQKGFGGHFHNDNSIAVLRDIPGIVIACPSNGHDAVPLLRECVRLAQQEQRVVVFLEPIALYMTRDLHEPKDGLWSFRYDEARSAGPISFGQAAVYGKGKELCILTYGNGYYLSRQAAKELTDKHEIDLRIVDLRWLHPLHERQIIEAVASCSHILIVDECRVTGSLSETLMALLQEKLPSAVPTSRIAARDSFIPLGRAATLTLPDRGQIVAGAIKLLGKG